MFTKAGEPGWLSLIPIVNLFILLKIAGKPWWFLILMFIPIINLIMSILVGIGLAEKFGKGAGTGILLAFLPFIGYPMLAFGDAEYQG